MTALLFAGILTSCNSQNSVTVNGEKMKLEDGMYAKIQTPRGDILLTLHDDKTPLTVANFVGLAEGKIENKAKAQGEPYYDGLKFHRVIKDFMIQGGDPMGNGSGGPGYSFADEFHPDLRHDGPGVLSMANSGPATNGSQFFITHKETPWLNDKHTVFGKVINGQEVVDAIQQGDAIEKVEIIRIGKKAKDFDAVKVFNEEQENALKEQEAKRKEQEENMAEILDGAESTPSGLYYVVLKEGDGPKPENGQTVMMNYAGYLPDGSLFDTSIEEVARENGKYDERRPYQPFAVQVGPEARVIEGWKEGLQLMKVGDRYKLIIPPQLGYGERGFPPVIPANSWLVFEVEMVSIQQ